jgi:hypothetical protein
MRVRTIRNLEFPMRRRTGEAQLESLPTLVRAYAAITAYLPRFDELERQIAQAYQAAAKTPATFSSVASILGPSLRSPDFVTRRVAWVAQHVFGLRAYCVGNFILQQVDAQYESSLVAQIAEFGYDPRPLHALRFIAAFEQYRPQSKIDALIVDPIERVVWVIKGSTFQQAKARRSTNADSVTGPFLFGPGDRPMSDVFVSNRALAGLLFAAQVVGVSFPSFDIRPMFMVVDEDPFSWHFQLHDLSGLYLKRLSGGSLCIDDYAIRDSSVLLKRRGIDPERLEIVAPLGAKDLLNRLPADRATRSYMFLNRLWEKQAGSERLEVAKIGAIADSITKKHMVVYPRDLRRHDVEDCLERGDLIERPRYEGRVFGLTPSGITQLLLLRRQLLAGEPNLAFTEADSHMLSAIRKQAQLWARYREGNQVINVVQEF